MNPTEISYFIKQIHQSFLRVKEFEYQLQRAKLLLRLKADKLTQACNLFAEQQHVRQKLANVAKELEQEVEIVAKTLQRRREQLDLAKTSREYDSLKLQIELDEMKNDQLTNEAVVALTELENSEIALLEAQKNRQESQIIWQAAEEEVHSLELEIQNNIRAELDHVQELVESLPKEHRDAIMRLKQESNEPITPIVDNDYCGSCHERLPIDIVLDVSGGAALCCPFCEKLLFVSEEKSI